ncbi:spore coat protein CotF [Desulfitispora alkaliphila]|uniref:spore coat protein n=1 Tax=Desulfitispora alkaliphila TaxID=622674 RepID=UPI003D238E58
MLQDKTMVNDALSMIKSKLTCYSNAIAECANPQLRDTLQQLRNTCEDSQYALFEIAETKGYYQPAMAVDDATIQQVKSELQS